MHCRPSTTTGPPQVMTDELLVSLKIPPVQRNVLRVLIAKRAAARTATVADGEELARSKRRKADNGASAQVG